MIAKILDHLTMAIALIATLIVQLALACCGVRAADSIDLFTPAGTSATAPAAVDLFGQPIVPASASTAPPPAAEVNLFAPMPPVSSQAERPFMYVYLPDWCQICKPMSAEIGKGNDQLRVIPVRGSDATFPPAVRAQAEAEGYPVCHWNAPSGRGAMVSGVRSLAELVELVRTEPRKSTPAATVTVIRHKLLK